MSRIDFRLKSDVMSRFIHVFYRRARKQAAETERRVRRREQVDHELTVLMQQLDEQVRKMKNTVAAVGVKLSEREP